MIRPIDFWLFGNGFGFGAPNSDQAFYWLSGAFYTWIGGHGAQLQSVQWCHPRPGEERIICGVRFRPFSSRRSGPRVLVSWATTLPHDLNEANAWLRQFKRHLSSPVWAFEYLPAQAIEARRAETQSGSVHESAVRQDAPETPQVQP